MTGAPLVVALFGATALGKSDVAGVLAARLGADIVVADSMQAYAGLPIVTNQPVGEASGGVRRHLVGWASPQEEVTVAEFAVRSHAAVDGALRQGRSVVVEGGSGLYLRAVLGDLAFGARPDQERRRALEVRWERAPEDVVEELRRRAPDVAERVDLRNGRRVIRALESLDDPGGAQTGELWEPGGRYGHMLFALVPSEDRAALKERIDRRVDEMLAAGALEEVAAARAAGPFSRTAGQAIGVRELCAVLDGELALPEAAARMKARTRALARRQLTWMRKLPDATLVPVAGRAPAGVAAEIIDRLREAHGRILAPARREPSKLTGGQDPVQPQWQGLGKVQFSKWQGLGNDYIVLHADQLPFELTPERVRLLCDRNLGIGSDGILLIGERTGEDRYALRIFNPDGSEAEMCGNGVRMVARKLKMEGLINGDSVVLETPAGEIVPRLGEGYQVTVDMGVARFGGEKLEGFDGDCVEESLHAAGRNFTFTFVDVGNPHAIIQSPWPLELVPLHEVGPMIEVHKYFPRKTNVEFVKVLGDHDAKVRVWERGVGETRACGTGATATAVALVKTGLCSSPVTVELPGGKLVIDVRPDWRVFMTGPAEEIYHGDLSLEFLAHLE